MSTLLSQFSTGSYTVVTGNSRARASLETENGHGVQVYRLGSSVPFSSRLDRTWQNWLMPLRISSLVRIVERTKPGVLVAVYPDYHFLAAAREAANRARIPWVAYLHDTLGEGLANTDLAARAARLQEQVFSEASRILVMSRGMADLYSEEYGLSCTSIEHTYPEPIPTDLPGTEPARQAFWSGAIYSINERALARCAEALGRIACPFLLATDASLSDLARRGFTGDHLRVNFFSRRPEYLNVLRQQSLLVLSLSWPDESSVHESELSTIFPTKTPEYLASGRPILVHCPEHYFLARFFREHGCGIAVTERSIEALTDACSELLHHPDRAEEMARSALSTARMFSPCRVATAFQAEVRKAAAMPWGRRVA
jgi:glycosyltransferase involved in cell wall biosynthesis